MNTTTEYNESLTEVFMTNFTTASPRSGGVELTTGVYGYARQTLWKIFPPIIITWGTVGNILTILVILRQAKRSSTSVYLLTLAISDMLILYSGPLRNWIKFVWDDDVRYLSDAGCKIQLYVTYVSVHFSSWLLVAVTWERALSVLMPHKVKFCCTPMRAGVTTLVMLILILCIDMFVPIAVTLNGLDNLQCSPSTTAFRDFRDLYFGWIDFAVVFAIPFILLLIGNTIIILQLRRSRHLKKAMHSSHGGKSNKYDETKSVSYLMIALCVIFFLTVTPVTVFQIYLPIAQNDVIELFKTEPLRAYRQYEFNFFLHVVFNLIGYTNAAFNFILYVFSGSKFRNELMDLIRCWKRASVSVVTSRSTKTAGTRITRVTDAAEKNDDVFSITESKHGRTNVVANKTAEDKKIQSSTGFSDIGNGQD